MLPSVRPASVAHTEWARRQDAVREAAREFEDLTAQDLRERLRGATSKPLSDQDLEQFRVDVRAAALDDLVDVLDQTVRGKLRGRRTVRIHAPRGYVVRIVKTLSKIEADEVDSRLRSRGWTDKQVQESFTSRLPVQIEPEVADDTSPQ